jgi:hypothetical protein
MLVGFRTPKGHEAYATYNGIRMVETERKVEGDTEVHVFVLADPPSGLVTFGWGHRRIYDEWGQNVGDVPPEER